MSLVGTPYRYGGNTPASGFDCSGLVAYVFQDATGLKLPHQSAAMSTLGGRKLDSDTFIGAAASYRAGSHIAVAMVTDRLPAGLQRFAALVVHVVMLSLAVFMVVYGAKLCMETWGQSIAELPWMPVGFSYLPVPVGGLFTLLFVLEHMTYGPQNNRAIVRFDHDIDHGEGAN